ncbi:glycosyltransferase family 4 protein [Variovorax sp. CY25R-8]|nr:glycosyltransferase family 4 protein [Variovorax sp. CY25R-8]
MRRAVSQQIRRALKAIWWLITPWQIPQRLRFLSTRRLAATREQRIQLLLQRADDVQRHAGDGRGMGVGAARLRWNSRNALTQLGHLGEHFLLPRQRADEVEDVGGAVRFCLDLLSRREDLRLAFPDATTGGADSAFAQWMAGEPGSELGLTDEGKACIGKLLASDFGARARQAFLNSGRVRNAMPHGLTVPGYPVLFEWFVEFERHDSSLSLEEIWWLFWQASEQPRLELVRALVFTPEWQKQFPDGATVFGRTRFVEWFRRTYGESGDWLDSPDWPELYGTAHSIRLAYFARSIWQAEHPEALRDTKSAEVFLAWLTSKHAGLHDESIAWCRLLDVKKTAVELVQPGVNVLGHFCYPSGLRVSVESLVNGLKAVGVQTSLRDVRTHPRDDPHHLAFDGLECFDITIVHVQPDPFFDEAFQRADLHPRDPRTFRIAYWYWEFDTIPSKWLDHLEEVDEVWAATEFVARGMRKTLTKPVQTIFPGLSLAEHEKADSRSFGVPGEHFMFLFTFHMASVMERKNPLGLVRAFRQAFAPSELATLVIKTSYGDKHPDQLTELQTAIEGHNILLIDEIFAADRVMSLMSACDAYISLHRSEGLGLTMAEAMLMGKPVIATRFSGNVDFMNEENSLLVDCELVTLQADVPPYSAGMEWAEPSEAHAAQLMRRVFDDRLFAAEIGSRARESALHALSVEMAGKRAAARLAEIQEALVSGDRK